MTKFLVSAEFYYEAESPSVASLEVEDALATLGPSRMSELTLLIREVE